MSDDGLTTLGTTAEERATARRLWVHLECVHVPQYFSPFVGQAHADLGLELPWGGYVAGRIAPMGAVGAEVATAVFHGFSPSVTSVLPRSWQVASPPQVHDTTLAAVGQTLAPVLAGLDAEVARAAELAREVSLLHPTVGRPLAAARSGAPWPDEPHLVLFEAATRIRESRGDGHVAALVAAGLDGCEAHLTATGDREKVRRILGPLRGWSEAEWDAAAARLRDRGLLDDDGELTDAGRALRSRIETTTDALAAPPWRAFGSERTERLAAALHPIATALAATELVPGVVARQLPAGAPGR